MDFSLIVAPEHRPPALPVAKQLTAWRAALSSWHCPASSQRPHPHSHLRLRHCVLHGTVGGFALCLAAGGFVVRADCGSFFYDLFWICMRRKQESRRHKKKLQHKCSAKWRRHRKRNTHTHTNRVTAPETHAWQQNNSIVGVEGEVGLQRCAGKWKQQWQKRGKKTRKNDAGKWVKKHFQADCSLKNQFEKLQEKKKSFSQLKGPRCAGKL